MAIVLKELSFIVKDDVAKRFFFKLLEKLHGEGVDADNLHMVDELRNVTEYVKDALAGLELHQDIECFDLMIEIETLAQDLILEIHDIDVSKHSITEFQFLELDTLRIIY